jgi:hypothetical protein
MADMVLRYGNSIKLIQDSSEVWVNNDKKLPAAFFMLKPGGSDSVE